jgi:hypothetical protein
MANTNTPTTLGNLEFSQIKESLTNYLSNQSTFAGYNFEGSALQSIIDLLSYNSFYYAFYANMINAEAFLDSAQKEDSLISLCKPLGYTVPARTSPYAIVQVSLLSSDADIASGTQFIATNADGVQYSFYNLETIPVTDQTTEPTAKIYEATSYIEFDALPTFDYDNQAVSIAVDNFDLASIRVTITERIDDNTTLEQIWTPVGNIGYTSRANENIYFVERTSNGFAIIFGSSNSVGRSIDSSIEKMFIRYITTSGSDANGLSTFTVPVLGGVVTTISESSGGKSAPTPSEVKFLAPKWFAAQERAVTVNDYKALLLQSGFFTNANEFNVFGGQDIVPPRYGRVFVSSNFASDDVKITEMINYLKERSVVTILPEYVSSNALNVYADFFFGLGPATTNTDSKKSSILAAAKSIFQTNYGTVAQYNTTFSASDFINTLRSNSNNDINTLIISPDNFNLYVKETLYADTDYTFNLQNELYVGGYGNYVDITEPFDVNSTNYPDFPFGSQGVFKIYGTTNSDKNNKINIQLWARAEDGSETQYGGDFGYFITNKGIINIKSGIINESALFTAAFNKKSFTIGTNYKTTFTYNNVTIF